jgi:hypothetical protein
VSDHNVCSVLAVAEQEATYQADPVVPNLNKIAWKEINARAGKLLIPEFMVRTALSIQSPTGKSYAERIDKLRTEREMSEIFEHDRQRPHGQAALWQPQPGTHRRPHAGERRLC